MQYKTNTVDTDCLEYELQYDKFNNISHGSHTAFAVFLRLPVIKVLLLSILPIVV